MTDQKTELEATGLQPTNNFEAALVQTIAPGQYTALVRGKSEGAAGVAICDFNVAGRSAGRVEVAEVVDLAAKRVL